MGALFYCFAIWLGLATVMISSGQNAYAAEPLKRIKLACNEFPPHKMEKSPDGLLGFDVEILQESFKLVGTKIKTQYFPWKRALKQTKSGKQDGLCSCSRSKDRDQWILYSEAIGDVGVGVFYRKTYQGKQPRAINDLKGLRVAVVRGYNLQRELEDAGVKPILVNNDNIGIRMLSHDRFDVFLSFRDTGKYILSKSSIADEYVYVEFRSSPYFACLSKSVAGAATVMDSFNKGLTQIKSNGVYEKILSKYR